MSLYRYTTINTNSINLLANSELYLSDPDKFNDLFDSKHIGLNHQYLKDYCNLLPKNKAGSFINDHIINFTKSEMLKLNTVKVCCFTTDYKNLKMWSHYANSHKGICIEYGLSKSNVLNKYYELITIGESYNFNALKNMNNNIKVSDASEIIKFIQPVLYLNRRPHTFEPNPFRYNSYIMYYLIKGKEWIEEKEYRLISENNELNSNYVKIKRSQLKSIYFGSKVDPADKQIIIDIIINNYLNNNKKVRLFQCKIHDSSRVNKLFFDEIFILS